MGDEAGTDRREFEFGDTLEQIPDDGIHSKCADKPRLRLRFLSDRKRPGSNRNGAQNPGLYGTHDRYFALHDPVRRRPHYARQKSSHGAGRTHQTEIPERHAGYYCFRQRCLANNRKRSAVPECRSLPYQYRSRAGIGHGSAAQTQNANKQIFMITDGKPTCLKEGLKYYKNSFGLDRKVVNKTLTLAAQARRLKIPITTFMIASDPYLQQFVEEFTKVNNGQAYYSSLQGLGHLVFKDYKRNKRKSF